MIKFISLNSEFNQLARAAGFEAIDIRIEDYKPDPNKRTYYVSPANSLCFMDGGIDKALSRIIFPNIEQHLKNIVKSLGMQSLVGKYYLPIGSSIIIDYDQTRSMISAPTMLLPQNVKETQNSYYATMAVLYNILVNRGENINNVDIIMTAMCCGYGKMEPKESLQQIIKAINDYVHYNPKILNQNIIILEPNLKEQPKYYQNTEWFHIEPKDIKLA